jgi:hypothetical protein
MEKVKIGNITHIQPTDITNEDAKNIETNPFTSSVTEFLAPVQIEFVKKYILLDTAGFGDTKGAASDLANSCGVINAIKECKYIRPILVISHSSIGDRFTGLKSLVHLLCGMINNISDNLESIIYIFTKF